MGDLAGPVILDLLVIRFHACTIRLNWKYRITGIKQRLVKIKRHKRKIMGEYQVSAQTHTADLMNFFLHCQSFMQFHPTLSCITREKKRCSTRIQVEKSRALDLHSIKNSSLTFLYITTIAEQSLYCVHKKCE